jgi:K+-sensing histidine kinase KdpD
MKSDENVVMLQHHHAVALFSSARWLYQHVRNGGELAGDPNQWRVALTQLQEAIDATTAQLDRQAENGRGTARRMSWRGYVLAVAAVLVATVVIEACCLLGSPRTVDGLYVPVVVGAAMLIGRWPALLGCALAFVLNDMLFVSPGRFAPGADQIAVVAVVMLSCLALNWLARERTATRMLGSIVALLAN